MKNYFLLYHNEVKQGQEGLSFYYSDVKQKLYLRYARFRKGCVSALVSTKHSKEKLKTDKLFEMHQGERDQCENWSDEVDNELILKPHFQVKDITSIYKANVFNLAADFGSGTGEKSFPENYLRKLAFFNKFKTLY